MNKTAIIQLIQRDLSAYKVNILALSCFMLIVSMFITFINTNTLGIFTSGIGNIIMVVIGSFAMEQSGSVIRMHTASLPVTRTEIVFARFGTSLIIVFLNTILHFIVFNALTTVIHQDPVYTDGYLLLFALVYGVFQLSIYYLVFYRVNMVVSVIIFVLPVMIWTSVSPQSGFLNDYIQGDPKHLILFTFATALILILSVWTTKNYYKKKNL
ncbi:MAG: ABC-2 transporter permease [Cytophagales bacterium]|nr:ABC-2 transporter permease [Cytophagales bacterium]